jgi:hypothetical protein
VSRSRRTVSGFATARVPSFRVSTSVDTGSPGSRVDRSATSHRYFAGEGLSSTGRSLCCTSGLRPTWPNGVS